MSERRFLRIFLPTVAGTVVGGAILSGAAWALSRLTGAVLQWVAVVGLAALLTALSARLGYLITERDRWAEAKILDLESEVSDLKSQTRDLTAALLAIQESELADVITAAKREGALVGASLSNGSAPHSASEFGPGFYCRYKTPDGRKHDAWWAPTVPRGEVIAGLGELGLKL